MSRFKWAIVISAVLSLAQGAIAWENQLTHPAITKNSAERSVLAGDYLQTQLGLDEKLDANLVLTGQFQNNIDMRVSQEPEFVWDHKTQVSILEWLKKGSSLEDVPNPRARHHFYDPIRNTGLNNSNSFWLSDIEFWSRFLYPTYWAFTLQGDSAVDRALGCANDWGIDWESEPEYLTPKYNWPTARNLFYTALTSGQKTDREKTLGSMFLGLGHICHLIEDQGVPAHTRNDFVSGHMVGGLYKDITGSINPWWKGGHPFEAWMETQIVNNGQQIPSVYLTRLMNTPPAFSKFKDYWDRGICESSGIAQWQGDNSGWPSTGFGNPPPEKSWGLAECSNYQFLSYSTIDGDPAMRQSFPHPSQEHTRLDWYSVNGRKQYYLAGYEVPHLARVPYVSYLLGTSESWKTCTVEEEQVYDDYAKRTIPRTIDYTTGLLNYFFRGKLEIEPNCLDCNTVTFKIRNISENSNVHQTLKGGMFELFWDDHDGNRTKINDFTIPGWTSSSTLNYDQQVTGTFNRPDSNEIEKYIVVYKGQISENPGQPDNDDSNAIAVATLKVGYPIIAWGRNTEGQVSRVPEGNDFVDVAAGKYHGLAIRSNGSLAAWGYNDYGQCDIPEGNDFVAIAGGKYHSIALRSDGSLVGFGDNSQNQIDAPEEKEFVAIACGEYHNLAINKQGIVVGWGGYNYYGECDAPQPDEGTIFVAVSAGRYHSLGLQSDGKIKAWGSNEMGQTRIYAGAGNDHEAIAAADTYNFLLLTDNMLVSWGGGDWFDIELKIPDYHWRLPDNTDFIAIAAGTAHIAALTSDGRVFCWSYDNFKSAPFPMNPVPTGVTFTKDIAAGNNFTVALKSR
jgi:alpha-tubulin suppressor-like RCC1 family protein